MNLKKLSLKNKIIMQLAGFQLSADKKKFKKIFMNGYDRGKFCTDESRIWFIDDLAGKIKYRSLIFEHIRKDF